MELNQKDWSCPKKQESRQATVISAYNRHFGKCLPNNKQYWTFAGQCTDTEGNPLKGCELDQITSSGLIKPEQYCGIEINPEIYNTNKTAHPNANFYCGDFYNVLQENSTRKDFNPGVVNIDVTGSVDGWGNYIAKTLALIASTSKDVLVLFNVMVRGRFYTTKNGNYVINKLNKEELFLWAMANGDWFIEEDYFVYDGTGPTGGRTQFATFILVKQ